MKVGLGVTTFKRPEHIALWKRQVDNYFPRAVIISQLDGIPSSKYEHETIIHIASDSETRCGIAYRKNECLKALKDCDYIFLFDDDCFPIKPGWVDFFIDAHKWSKQHHFLYLKETSTIKKEGTIRAAKEEMVLVETLKTFITAPVIPFMDIEVFNNCGGCFMFLTKEVIEKVGGYNKNYGIYGYEHAGYTERIHLAGLTPMGRYLCPAGAGNYIYSMDYDFHLPFNTEVKHESSLSRDFANIKGYLEKNLKVFEEDIKTVYRPL